MDDEKKQVEAMEKVIEITEQVARDAHCGYPSPTMYAKALYWKGYRRQIEGEWRLEECQSWLFGIDQYFVCSACNQEFIVEGWDYEDLVANAKYCPNCGAKMKGITK